MIEISEFYKRYESSFDNKNCYQTLINIPDTFENNYLKVDYIHRLMENLCDQLFFEKDLYIVLFIWNTDRNTTQELIICGFDENKFDFVFKNIKIDDIKLVENPQNIDINLLYKQKYDYLTVKSIVQAIAGFEIGVEPSCNVSAYFICFSEEADILVNLYDDRGIEILTTDKSISTEISEINCEGMAI